MMCEKCGKYPATTHIKTVVNGVLSEKNLCSHCAATYGYGASANAGLAGMLASMLGDVIVSKPASAKKCPVCGSTFSDIAKRGKAGCTECYTTFKAELLPYLKRVHGSTKHMGKVPNNAPLAVVPKEETIESLRMELNNLVAEEKYEQAAVIRDKIRKMEGKENG